MIHRDRLKWANSESEVVWEKKRVLTKGISPLAGSTALLSKAVEVF